MHPHDLARHPIDTAAHRLPEFTAHGRPILITQDNQQSWVFMPQRLFNELLSAACVCDTLNEQHRQQLHPLPDVSI